MESNDEIRARKANYQKKRMYLCGVCVAIFFFFLGALAAINGFTLDFHMIGDYDTTLEYGNDYFDEGAIATIQGKYFLKNGAPLSVATVNSVDQNVLGNYNVEYSIGIGNLRKSIRRNVHVVDTVSPEIILFGGNEVFALPGMEYSEPGFSAADNYDGDLTDMVETIAKQDCIIYRVSDQSGNVSEAKRLLIRQDDIAPEITLLGENPLSIVVGSEYSEPGFSALDNYDGDLTGNVVVKSEVDTEKPGEYAVSYVVQDQFGNAAEIQRSVTVIGANKVETVVPAGKVIYLTFDDGPSCYTEKLLDILEQNDVKATFFVVNTDYCDLISEIVERGHSVGIHSASHRYKKIYASEDAYLDDLHTMQNIIFEKSGHKTFLMRFPGGSSNTVSKYNPGIMTRLSAMVGDLGFQYFDWNVDSGDASTAKTADDVAKNVICGVQNKDISIVLQHDSKGFSVEAVEEIIKWGKENGYQFLPLSPDSPCVHHGINN